MTAAVVGVGATPFTRRPRATEAALAARAIVAALKDAGLRPADVDGVVRYDRDALWEYDLPGVRSMAALHFYNALPFAPGSAPALLRMAAMAVEQGLATTVVCWHAARPSSPPVIEAAMLARRHGVAERAVAAVTLAHRRAAARNPRALVRRTLTAAARRASPWIAEPLRRVDVATGSSGACALVVTDAARARRRPVRILASMQAAVPSLARHLPDWLARRPLDEIARAARGMFRAARVAPSAVDVACVGAETSALVPLALAAYGIRTARVNPHGGQLCEAALDGVNDVVEAVRQLRGDAASPVRGARTALVAGSIVEPTSGVLLGV
jgi:17-hydroxy-3-oxo-4-pregnene-20-carboxyl-CoA lyase